mgnify:CR=1 FL=1
MYLTLQKISNALLPIRQFLLFSAVCLMLFIAYQLIFPVAVSVHDNLLKICLLGLIWLLLFYSIIITFSGKRVDSIETKSWLAKFKHKLATIMKGCFVIFFFILTVAIVIISTRMLNVL